MATKKTAKSRESRDLFPQILAAAKESAHCPFKKSLCEDFLSLYYTDVSIEDLKDYAPEDLANAALSHANLAAKRQPGEMQVRVYNPQPKTDHWRSLHTIIETVTADMPFLVDSITMVAQQHDLSVHQTTHPVIAVKRREETGEVEAFASQGSFADSDESFVHLEVDHISGSDKLERIRQDIERSLMDTIAAVNDWTAMRNRAEGLAYELDPATSPLDPGEIEEGRHFLHWLVDNRFTFLGYREYKLEKHAGNDTLCSIPGSGLGILRDKDPEKPLTLTGELRARARARELVIITKTNAISTVHRPAPLDYIGFKRFDEKGEVCGEYRFLGLFTSQVYSHSPSEIPIVRRKMQHVLSRSHLQPNSHAGKGLVHALETLPRDELFQASEDELYDLTLGILHIQERSQVRMFVRRDAFGRFYSCLVYVPRERYNSTVRERIQNILSKAFGARGEIEAFVHMGESRLARVHLIVHTRPWQHARIGYKRLERALSEASRTWDDRLRVALIRRYGEEKGMQSFEKWGRRFPLAYQEEVEPQHTLQDIRTLNKLSSSYSVDIRPYRPEGSPQGVLRLKVFSHEQPIIVSDILPLLENMGMRIIAERPYRLQLADDSIYWIHDFDALTAEDAKLDLREVAPRFREAFLALWNGISENDSINNLILTAELDWQQARIIRAYAKYLLQTGMPFGERYIERVVADHPEIIVPLVRYFEARFDPDLDDKKRTERTEAADQEIQQKITELSGQDEDRILRALAATMKATLRTNHFLRNKRGQRRHFLSFKLDSAQVPELPLPRPLYEIFVFAPHVEGIHLRGGRVARGGIRWSDRQADYRTEVLGLMKAQMVKNTVIIPGGSKGGFITKRLPKTSNRDTVLTEVKRCYRDYMRGLLDITDNIVNGKSVHPQRLVCHDEMDPYLVVAADKGTASFSDLANEVAADYSFWLGDAFASGGSVGYDHKGMGITAKGAWESVRRLFGEIGIDPEKNEISAIGIGDMAGDVFGNGMLLSKTLCLKAAFNHQHIFIDPTPDAAQSFRERKRLFELPRSSWDDYDRSKISEGGGIYERSAKTIRLSKQAQEALGTQTETFTPQQLIKTILQAPVDLFWNGGIGTYVKSAHESDIEVGDRSNDAVRINGRDLRCKVVGEGGNLGFTQRGRIEFALNGGRITTDFIDNSAGVDCSDHEVNIKILLNVVRDQKRLSESARRDMLMEMTDEVERLVLRDNYLQSLALSVAEAQSLSRLNEHAHLIRSLERQGTLNRQLEFLPTEDEISERRTMEQGMTRPELAVLLAYSKITLYNELDAQALANDAYLKQELVDYFPTPLQKNYAALMPKHPLQAEIIATAITNSMINRMGPTFPFRIKEETGANMSAVARAYTIARESLKMVEFWRYLEQMGSKVPARKQSEIIIFTGHLVRHATRWILEHGYGTAEIRDTVDFFGKACEVLNNDLPSLLSGKMAERYKDKLSQHIKDGMDKELAARVAALPYLFSAFDIAEVASTVKLNITDAANAYFLIGADIEFDWVREQIESLPADDHWKSLGRATLREGLYAQQRRLTIEILSHGNGKRTTPAIERVENWVRQNTKPIEHFQSVLSEIRSTGQIELASMSVALQEAHALARGGRSGIQK